MFTNSSPSPRSSHSSGSHGSVTPRGGSAARLSSSFGSGESVGGAAVIDVAPSDAAAKADGDPSGPDRRFTAREAIAEHDAEQLETLANQPDEKELVSLFKLLADETRLRVLMNLMRERELHVSALCERLDQSQPAVSHHLSLLRVNGLIEARRDGKHNFYSVRRQHFHKVMGHLFNCITDEVADEQPATLA